MQNFDSLGLPEPLMHALAQMQFTTPTPIQAESIPHALKGKDILGSAQTGTGKTGAFGIPLVSWLYSNPQGMALVLTPTRELAVQVLSAVTSILGGRNSTVKTALLIGGDSMGKQLQQLQAKPRVVVGTPGRINDHLARGWLKLHNAGFLVLDEMDRMLDIGLAIQIEKIIKYTPKERQTLMFSATMPQNIIDLSQKYLKDPIRVSMGSTNKPVSNIKQETIMVDEADKYSKLISELNQRTGSIIVFVKTKFGADRLATKLTRENHSADAIHGDLRQNKRDRVISAFRNQKYRIMVATDLAARGLDIPHIEHVINYDLPQCPEDYIHRIGRTARAGAEGFAVNLIAPSDSAKWRAIHRLLNPGEKCDIKGGVSSDRRPKPNAFAKAGERPFNRGPGRGGPGKRPDDFSARSGRGDRRKPGNGSGYNGNGNGGGNKSFRPRRPSTAA